MKITKSKTRRLLNRTGILKILKTRRADIQAFGVRYIGLFGSFAKGRTKSSSDIDILVEFSRPTFDQYMDLKFFLEDLFGRKVDLVLRNALKPALRDRILSEVVHAPGF